MPSGEGRLDRAAEAEGGAAEEGALDEAMAGRGLRKRAGAVQRRAETGGSTPCPAVAGVGALPCGRPWLGVEGRPHGVAPTEVARRFCGSTPCPAVRRILSDAKSASMRWQ